MTLSDILKPLVKTVLKLEIDKNEKFKIYQSLLNNNIIDCDEYSELQNKRQKALDIYSASISSYYINLNKLQLYLSDGDKIKINIDGEVYIISSELFPMGYIITITKSTHEP